jgi:hypothetical protein
MARHPGYRRSTKSQNRPAGATPTVIAFLDIYTKNAKEDLTGADKPDIRSAITEIRAALR